MTRALTFWAAVAIQVAILVGMIGSKFITLHYGREILLETVPVDPRSLFSGDYVNLSYQISDVGAMKALDGKGAPNEGETVYVVLEPRGRLWAAKGFQRALPAGADPVFIKGVLRRMWGRLLRIEFGIESYYVPEGKGRKIEEAIRRQAPRSGAPPRSRVEVEVRVDGRGNAVIRRVLLDGEALPY